MKKAMFYIKTNNGKVICKLCPHNCIIAERKKGFCNARQNIKGELYTLNYGKLSGINIDPIEKKPLYHFFPGQKILSIGSFACNMTCLYCQNWEISEIKNKNIENRRKYQVKEIIEIAKKKELFGIAYTYNEPFVWFEYMYDVAKEAKKIGIKNVVVTNAYINKEALLKLIPYIDAFSVDLKSFNSEFYKKITNSKLESVKETLIILKENGKYFEIDFLLIQGLNDDLFEFKEMLNWIRNKLGKDTVLHINRYFPNYKLSLEATSIKKLEILYEIAIKVLDYVYIGNVKRKNNTNCPYCNEELIIRENGDVKNIGLTEDGTCKKCFYQILGEDRID